MIVVWAQNSFDKVFFSLKLNRKASVISKAFKYDPRRRQRENGFWQPYLCENIWHARVVSPHHVANFSWINPPSPFVLYSNFSFFYFQRKAFFKNRVSQGVTVDCSGVLKQGQMVFLLLYSDKANPNLRMLLLLRQLILADKQSSKCEISIKLYINIQQRDS